MAWLRRLIWLALLAGGGVLAYSLWQRRQHEQLPEPEWPPFTPAPNPLAPSTAPGVATAVSVGASDGWLPPVDGECPVGHPVKVSERSGIYHVPGGRFYERLKPDRCYATAAAAEADGYRASKS